MMKSVLLCVATERATRSCRPRLRSPPNMRIHVCTFDETHVARSFAASIRALAEERQFPLVRWSDFKRDAVGYLRRQEIDGLLCIGWRYLIPAAAVAHLQGRAVAAHDSLLPHLRGFAPLPTALIIGDTQAGVTFLRWAMRQTMGTSCGSRPWTSLPDDTIADLIRLGCLCIGRAPSVFCKGTCRRDGPRMQHELHTVFGVMSRTTGSTGKRTRPHRANDPALGDPISVRERG